LNGTTQLTAPGRLPPGAVAPFWRAEPRRAVINLVAAAAGSAIALYLTTDTSRGASLTTVGLALGAMLLTWMLCTRRVAFALAIAIGYIGLLDGFVRLKTGSSTLTMGRDAFLYAVSIGMLIRAGVRREHWQWPPLTIWVIGWVVFVLVQLLNPASGPTLHRIVSLRQDLEFVPLFFLGYALVRSKQRLRSLLILILAISAVNGAVGLYQSTLSPGQMAAWGPGYNNLVMNKRAPGTAVGANGQKVVRPPALGGDMGFAGALGMISLPGGVALLLIRRRRPGERVLIGTLLIFTVLGVITSQSRANLLSAVIGLLAFGALLAASREGKRLLVGLLVCGAVVAMATSVLSSGSLTRYSSIAPSNLSKTVGQSRAGIGTQIGRYLTRFPFGAGIGSAGPAFGQFGASANTTNGESQITFLISEVGIPGLILFLAFQARAIGSFVKRLRQVDESDLRILLAAMIAPLFALVANWYVGVNTVSPPNAPYMWGAIGVLSFWLLARRATPSLRDGH
jgi:O-Antigen ligase